MGEPAPSLPEIGAVLGGKYRIVRRIGEGGGLGGLFTKRRPTLMFNGYEPQVGQLYAGMDLRKDF